MSDEENLSGVPLFKRTTKTPWQNPDAVVLSDRNATGEAPTVSPSDSEGRGALGDPEGVSWSPVAVEEFAVAPREDNRWAELRDWYIERAVQEIDPMLGKMIEYGGAGRAQDLIDIGRQMAALRGHGTVTDEQATELGIFFYIVGKLGRWQAAVVEGRPVSDDTLHDIGIYVRMAQRNRTVGGWPF